ncbi:MAG TPA: T9SS type A sorting domain-containing protein [Cyclobacteriaceae bacterium]|nr:T9SS type A sorting domain-containing protein [Cyclobacteriaceae bacterium]MCB9238286.1 T9SS type A sorting domain-containing protein [Flammeovirgaceae bacterium]MCO5272211.1 T9SS type A sorting domain-containing protein [Cyclobacteriaceae bacterium]MCW5902674.1 T9SS type A sorting domain-containing protein [Cyclobacteriaceae bacterium]HOO09756.1 T9SS type A sorting domain-containing protein [Cyclobacteriaceae bacterium]
MRAAFISILCFAMFLNIKAQTFQSSVIGSTGGNFRSPSGSMAWTIGEIMTETYAQAPGYLTQGFHQPSKIIVTYLEEENSKLTIYPNPVRDLLFVEIEGAEDHAVELYNFQGQKLVNVKVSGKSSGPILIDMQGYSVAMYLLRVINLKNRAAHNVKIVKY